MEVRDDDTQNRGGIRNDDTRRRRFFRLVGVQYLAKNSRSLRRMGRGNDARMLHGAKRQSLAKELG